MRELLTFRESSATQWALLTMIIGALVLAGIPLFERIAQFADEVEFRYLANAFQGSAQNVQLRATLKNENNQQDIVTVDGVSFRLIPAGNQQKGFPFALKNGANNVSNLRAEDCGALLEQFTGQSYWLDDSVAEALARPQPRFRAIVVFDKGISPYCRFERPARSGFWEDEASKHLAHHVFAYYPTSGRVEILNKTGEK